jgi:S1-C subfamily serine protease
MSRTIRYARALPLLAALAFTTPAGAQGVLKQMQREVSAIVGHARSAVLTIEDTRPIAEPELRRFLYALPDARQKMLGDLDALIQKSQAQKTRPGAQNPKSQTQKDRETEEKALRQRIEAWRLWDQAGVAFKPGEPAIAFTDPTNPLKSGTGFSIGKGYILTTADVADGMKSPTVVTDDGTRIKAQLVGVDMDMNVGLLKLQDNLDLPALKLGVSSTVKPGSFAISIGNQSGEDNSVALTLVGGLRTEGLYSGSHFYPGMIQIAGTVGAGSSGAPLLDADGDVIGVIAAIPADDLTLVGTLREQNNGPNTLFFQNRLQVDEPTSTIVGPWKEVKTEGLDQAAPAAGVDLNVLPAPKPVETKRGGRKTQQKSPKGKPSAPSNKRGQTLDVWKSDVKFVDAATKNAYVTLATPMQEYAFDPPSAPVRLTLMPTLRSPVSSAGFAIPIDDIKPVVEALEAGRPVVRGWIGVNVEDETHVVEKGALIARVRSVKITGVYADSPALRSGLQPGDVIVRLNSTPVRSAVDVRATIQRLRPGDAMTVVSEGPEGPRTREVKIEKRPATVDMKLITERQKR